MLLIEILILVIVYPIYLYSVFYISNRLFPFDKLSIWGKIVSSITFLGFFIAPIFIIVALMMTQPFSREGLAKGIIVGSYDFQRGRNSSSEYKYIYKLEEVNYGTAELTHHKDIDIGDTIDVIYDLDNVTNSYPAFYNYTESLGLRKSYKKYWDKIASTKGIKSKYVGTLP
jgi:hypothetical protein